MVSVVGALFWVSLLPVTLAQFPSSPSGLTVVGSKVNSQVSISYKQTDICERSPGVESYSGYVNFPGSSLSDVGGYDIHTYFAYFEARNNPSTAPLAIYLAGGPGESSLYAALAAENGPCYVNIDGTDTINNTWSFNNYANVLYIDQPVQVGFSYDTLVNATFDIAAGLLITPTDFEQASPPEVNATLGYGTFPSQNFDTTANTTVSASKFLWDFAEHWLSSFPEYYTESNKVSIWGNSYGGYWVPETAARFSKNLINLPCQHPLQAKNLIIDSIGITNGCVDIESAMMGYPDYAYNNTYGVPFGSEDIYEEAVHNLTKPEGCQDLISQCRALSELSDPGSTGSNATINELCVGTFYYCFANVVNSFPGVAEHNAFDIAQPYESPCPFYLPAHWYLNTGVVQQALGVPLNFTYNSNVVASNFGVPSVYTDRPVKETTGDAVRQNGLPNIEYLLSHGTKVAFIFGDRDYRCPWTGGEATALATNWTHQSNFATAGYTEMQGITTPVIQGGLKAVVKQYGIFSFSRVLDAGHSVGAYAPETVYRIFERTLKGLDVVSGTISVVEGNGAAAGYMTTGPRDSWSWRNTLPQRNLTLSCMVAGQFQQDNPWSAILGES